MTMVGRTLDGRYSLDALIGAGGMATVYRARDVRLERDVAVKVLSPNLAIDPALAERFDREARFLAGLSHPSVVAVHDVGESDGDRFYVMELVEGESLAERLSAAGRLAPDVVLPVIAAVGEGLAALHDRGFVHRDVKPHNILLAPSGAKLADFGLVRDAAASELTAPGTTVGTLAYLAPELLRGEPATAASDVYALAAVAYLALTGRLPYPADTVAGLVAAHATPPPRPSEVVPELGRELDDTLLAALGPADSRPAAAAFASSLTRGAPDAGRGTTVAPVTAAPAGPAVSDATQPAPVARVSPHAMTAPTRITGRRSGRGSLGRLAPWLAPLAVLAIAAIVLFLLSGAAGGRPGAGDGTGTPGTEGSATPPGSANSQRTEAPSATPAATPTRLPAEPAAAISTALDDFAAVVDAARGGQDGLRGNQANDLRAGADEVRRAVEQGDGDNALQRAGELADRTSEIVDESDLEDTEVGRTLLAAADNVLATVRAAYGGGDG